MIPLHETPIYDQLKAEYEKPASRIEPGLDLEAIKQGFIAIGNAGRNLPLATPTPRKPLLKKGNRR